MPYSSVKVIVRAGPRDCVDVEEDGDGVSEDHGSVPSCKWPVPVTEARYPISRNVTRASCPFFFHIHGLALRQDQVKEPVSLYASSAETAWP